MKRILFASFFLPLFSLAQTKDSGYLEPVEVRAVRASPTAPFAKTNLDKEAIRKQNLGADLPFLLNLTPSVVVNSDAGNGVGYTGIRIRGTDPTRINVTLNGIPYNDAESGGTFFVDLPDMASSLSSIQVQRGAGTSTNGPSSFGATINLSTNEVPRESFLELNNSFGSFNTWKNTIRGAYVKGKWSADLRLSSIRSDGYIERAASNLKAAFFTTAYTTENTSLRINVITGKEKTYQAWHGVSAADLLVNRRINYAGKEKPGTPYENETDNYRQDHLQLFFNQKLSTSLWLNLTGFYTKGTGYYEQYKAGASYSDYGITSPTPGSDETDLVRQRWLDNDYYGSIFSIQWQGAKTNIITGGAVTRYDGDHFGKVIWAEKGLPSSYPSRYYDVDGYKTDFNLYTKVQQQLSNNLSLFGDLQYRRVAQTINGFSGNPQLKSGGKYAFFNPKAGLTYTSGPWNVFASYSIANKEPNRDDFESSLSIPSPERLNDIEIGIENKTGRRMFSANFYRMDYKDQLVLTGKINDVGAYTRTNVPNSYRMGIELQGSYRFFSWLNTSANLTLSKNEVKNFTEFVDDWDAGGQKQYNYNNTPLAFSPSVTGAGIVTILPLKGLSADLISKYVGRQFLDNTGMEAKSLDPYFTEDVRVIYTMNTKALKRIDFILQVNNVFNAMYEPNGYTYSGFTGGEVVSEVFYFPMAGRNLMVGVNLKF